MIEFMTLVDTLPVIVPVAFLGVVFIIIMIVKWLGNG
jgi:hypothetical protein